MQIDKDIYVPMRDGVSLAVDLYRPDELTSHAVLLMITPYRKDSLMDNMLNYDGRPVDTMVPPPPPGTNIMLFAAKGLVEAGYVVAVADARGTGYSEGIFDYYNLVGGPYDGYDLVEWLAEQPWSTGKVGMFGPSAAAIACYTTALTHPPHLGAISPNMHPADFYFDQWYVGGVFRWANRVQWATIMIPNIGLVDPGSPDSPNYERKRAVYEARFHRHGERIASGQNTVNVDWATEMYAHKAYDDFWKGISFIRRAGEIDVPTLHSGVWFDHFARGTLMSHEAVDVPKQLFMSPGMLMSRTDLADGGFMAMERRWFDHFLRGEENGVLDERGARLYLTGREDYADFAAWPVPADDTDLFLGAGGTLTAATPAAGSATLAHDPDQPNRSPASVADQRSFEAQSLVFTTAPADQPMQIIGTPRLVLHASSTATDLDWCVRLCDVDHAGVPRFINNGALKGSHRHSHEHPEPLAPGETNCFEIEIWPIAHELQPGHSLRVDVSLSDFPFFENNRLPGTATVQYGAEHPSRLILPVTR